MELEHLFKLILLTPTVDDGLVPVLLFELYNIDIYIDDKWYIVSDKQGMILKDIAVK